MVHLFLLNVNGTVKIEKDVKDHQPVTNLVENGRTEKDIW